MRKYLFSFLLITMLLILWEIIARTVNIKFILPTPSAICLRLWDLRLELFLNHLPVTFIVIAIGLAASIILGVSLAIAMNLSSIIERAIYPILLMSQTIPVIALAPIFVLWFGYSIWSKIVMTILITFFPITVSTIDGFQSRNKQMKELLLTMGANQRDIFFKLDIPSALPYFFSGVKVAVPLSVIGAAIGEWFGAQAGLGYFSRRMMTQFDGAGVFAPIVILSMVGIILFILVVWIERITIKWRQ